MDMSVAYWNIIALYLESCHFSVIVTLVYMWRAVDTALYGSRHSVCAKIIGGTYMYIIPVGPYLNIAVQILMRREFHGLISPPLTCTLFRPHHAGRILQIEQLRGYHSLEGSN